jgi:hypothetical protein
MYQKRFLGSVKPIQQVRLLSYCACLGFIFLAYKLSSHHMNNKIIKNKCLSNKSLIVIENYTENKYMHKEKHAESKTLSTATVVNRSPLFKMGE